MNNIELKRLSKIRLQKLRIFVFWTNIWEAEQYIAMYLLLKAIIIHQIIILQGYDDLNSWKLAREIDESSSILVLSLLSLAYSNI